MLPTDAHDLKTGVLQTAIYEQIRDGFVHPFADGSRHTSCQKFALTVPILSSVDRERGTTAPIGFHIPDRKPHQTPGAVDLDGNVTCCSLGSGGGNTQ